MKQAVLLSCWSKVHRDDLRKLLRKMVPDKALEILDREIPSGRPDEEETAAMTALAESKFIQAVIFGEEGYPEILNNIPDPPVVLFYKGDLQKYLSIPSVAVIGSRRCTTYGRRVARKLARDFVYNGVGVVSGLARGIDAEAHRGALDAGGRTMAVLGSGLDVCYPPEHENLALKITGNGVLISEYPPGTQPAKFRFPERNRLISGFSRGVVVVEAGRKSGTMITVNTALDQGREVFAVPGEITRALSMGTNMLLRDGAGVVITARDVLEPLGIAKDMAERDETFGFDSEVTRLILKLLSEEALHFDKLLRLTEMETPLLQSELLKLEIAGVIRQHPGKNFSLI